MNALAALLVVVAVVLLVVLERTGAAYAAIALVAVGVTAWLIVARSNR